MADIKWREDSTFDVMSPIDGQVLQRIRASSRGDIDDAVARANRSFKEWSRTTPFERATLLQGVAARIRAQAGSLSRLIAHEGGKPVREGYYEVQSAADAFDFYAGLVRTRAGRVAPDVMAGSTSLVVKDPLGVIGAILPWNFPILLWAWKAAPALAAGNTVVAKPSPETPLSLPSLVEALDLPDDTHQIIQGDAEVGEALVRHPGIAKIAFTGSSSVGKRILALCGSDARRCTVEMSGHDALIVWDDVPLDLAVEGALFATMVNNGQVCTAAERLFVKHSIAEPFTERLIARMSQLKVGNPLEEATQVGPLVANTHRQRMEDYCQRARKAGAQVLLGGASIPGPGAYFQPTVLGGLSHERMNDLGEVFGPIAPIASIETFEEGIARANDNRFGLSAHVITSNLGLAMKAARELRVGTVWINNSLGDNCAAPFGGFREAGIGRELGEEGLDAYTESKHIWITHEIAEQPYWFSRFNFHPKE